MSDPFGGRTSGLAPSTWSTPALSVARVGDHGSHAHAFIGVLISGSPTTAADGGKAICRVGDTYLCPVHGPNLVVSGSGIFKDNGSPVARVGDSTQCGATIDEGSPTFNSA